MSKFFINRPIVAIVISILTVIVGAVTIVSLPVAQFPQIAPPEVQVSDDLCRRRRANDRAVRRHADRTADERRRQHELHVLAELTANGQMRLIVNFDVATDPNTDLILAQLAAGTGRLAASRGGHELWRHGAEDADWRR